MRQAELASDGVCVCVPPCVYLEGREVICLLHALTWPHAAIYLRICAFAYQVGTWCAHWW